MSKVRFTRENFHSSLLKNIIIRIDYSEVSNLDGAVGNLNGMLNAEYFENKQIHQANKVNMTLKKENIDEGMIPVSLSSVQKIHSYTNCKLPSNQKVKLDISSTFSCITIQCDEKYNGLDDYITLMSKVVSKIQEYDSFVQIGRVGIRKVDGDDFETLEQVKEVFPHIEENPDSQDNFKSCQRNKTYLLLNEENKMQVNLTQSMIMIGSGYRIVLDMDGYWNEVPDELMHGESYEEILIKILTKINDSLFDLFKEYVSESFLEKGLVAS